MTVPGPATAEAAVRLSAGEDTVARWTSPAWSAELDRWVADALSRHGVAMTGTPVVHKLRPWAVVYAVPTDRGRFFAKQNCAGQLFEAGLLSVLNDVVPGRVLSPAALDTERGLLLLPDGGPVLSTLAAHDIDVWCRVVAEWADVQRAVVSHVDALRGVGVTEVPTASVAELVAARAEALHMLPHSDPRHLDEDGVALVRRTLPDVLGWAEAVRALGLPTTLNHNDLHANNAFVPVAADAPLRFFDLADSVLGDPLATLLVPLDVLGTDWDAGPSDPRLRRVADAFLEVWSDLVPIGELRSVLPAALHLARMHRHESWWRCAPHLYGEALTDHGAMVGLWLQMLADPPPVHFHTA